ncbi:hypothetical protein RA27_17530 [Ruegeria sp. ANG-R]|nr:hypothetical protein RA27_17530 [Ruegeria sp. ANG-R]
MMSAVARELGRTGTRPEPLLAQAGINSGQLSDPYGEIPLLQFVRFLETSAHLTSDPHIGAGIGTRLSVGDLGPVGIALSLSQSIDVGISRFSRFSNALQGGTESQWVEDGGMCVFTYRVSDPKIWPRKQDSEFSLASLVHIVRSSFWSRWSPDEVHFEHEAPHDVRPLQALFGCKIRFAQPINRFLVEKERCLATARTEDPAHLMALERHITEIMGSTLHCSTLSASVSALIDASLGLSPVTLARVARVLKLTPRSLQRKLSLEGTSFREVLERQRKDKAKVLLSNPNIKVSDVSERLGYSDPTAFWRAWKSWTGESPTFMKKTSGHEVVQRTEAS